MKSPNFVVGCFYQNQFSANPEETEYKKDNFGH